MAYLYHCDISLQDCETLWPPIPPIPGYPNQRVLPWFNGSCVQDVRLLGVVGRCGWPGAPCNVINGKSNCAYATPQMCRDGICVGAVGDPCSTDDDCNFGIYCNATVNSFTEVGGATVCGGAGAQVDTTDFSRGLDFGRDYCLSGLATKLTNGPWICAPGPALILSTTIQSPTRSSSASPLPSSTSPSSTSASSSTAAARISSTRPPHVAPIVGGVIGGAAFLVIFVLAWLLHRKRSLAAGIERVVSVTREEMEHNSVDSHLQPTPFPFTGWSSSFPASHLNQPHDHGELPEDLPPPFSEVENGRGFGVQILLPPNESPPYSKRPRS